MTLSLDSVVRVVAELSPPDGPARNFDRAIFVYQGEVSTEREQSDERARDGRVNVYSNLAAVQEVYGSEHTAARAAQVYFAQSPMPRALLTAGIYMSGSPPVLFGAGRSTPTQLTAIKNLGTADVTIAGGSVSVDLNVTRTGARGYAALAAVLQTAFRAAPGLSEVVVEYSDSAFVISGPAGVDLGGPLGGDAADALGLGADDATYSAGMPEETVADGLARVRASNSGWYWLCLDGDIHASDDGTAAAQWASATPGVQGIMESAEPGVLVPNETTSRAAGISALRSDRTPVVWSKTADYKSIALAGSMSSIDLDARNSLRTAKFLTLRGTLPDTLSSTEKAELDRKRINHYSPFGPTPIFAEGWTLGGWIDTRLWLDWMIARIQTDVFNLLRSPRRVGLTPQGQSVVQNTIERACEAGRRNGGLATRTVTEPMAADIRDTIGTEFSGVLQRGYKVYAPPIGTLTPTQREDRRPTPFRVWLAYSSFAHSVDIALSLDQ